jgi:hypothetical protein
MPQKRQNCELSSISRAQDRQVISNLQLIITATPAERFQRWLEAGDSARVKALRGELHSLNHRLRAHVR